MTSKTIAKPCAQSTLTAAAPIPTAAPFDLIAELKKERERNGFSHEKLAARVGCSAADILQVEAGTGGMEILIRMMDFLKVDLTGLSIGTFLPERLRDTRAVRKKWTVERLARECGFTATAIEDIERGVGPIDHFLRVLHVLAPQAGRRAGLGGFGVGEKDSRFTSEELLAFITRCFGHIDFDPCAHTQSHVHAPQGIYWERGEDGLTLTWAGSGVFVNPPFTKAAKCHDRILEVWETRKALGITKIICLLPASTESRFFRRAPEAGGSIFFFEGRLDFEKPDGTSEPSKLPMALVVFGASDREMRRFEEEINCGFWWKRRFRPNRPVPGTEPTGLKAAMRRKKKIRTSCPNPPPPAHVKDEAARIPAKPASRRDA